GRCHPSSGTEAGGSYRGRSSAAPEALAQLHADAFVHFLDGQRPPTRPVQQAGELPYVASDRFQGHGPVIFDDEVDARAGPELEMLAHGLGNRDLALCRERRFRHLRISLLFQYTLPPGKENPLHTVERLQYTVARGGTGRIHAALVAAARRPRQSMVVDRGRRVVPRVRLLRRR